MKAILVAALLFVSAVTNANTESFDHWMSRVYKIAPAYDLELHPRDPKLRQAEREWFYAYYWLGSFTPREAVMSMVEHQRREK